MFSAVPVKSLAGTHTGLQSTLILRRVPFPRCPNLSLAFQTRCVNSVAKVTAPTPSSLKDTPNDPELALVAASVLSTVQVGVLTDNEGLSAESRRV